MRVIMATKNRLEKKTRTRHARAAGRLQASHRLRAPPLKCEMPAGPPPSPHPQAQIEGLWVMHTSYCLLPVSLSLLVGARWAAVGYERARSSPRTSSPTSHLPPRAAREAGLQGGWGGGGGAHVALVSSLSRRASLGFERGGDARTVRLDAVSVLVSVRLLDVEDEACRGRRRREAFERLHLRRRRRRLRHVRGERRVGRLGSGRGHVLDPAEV